MTRHAQSQASGFFPRTDIPRHERLSVDSAWMRFEGELPPRSFNVREALRFNGIAAVMDAIELLGLQNRLTVDALETFLAREGRRVRAERRRA